MLSWYYCGTCSTRSPAGIRRRRRRRSLRCLRSGRHRRSGGGQRGRSRGTGIVPRGFATNLLTNRLLVIARGQSVPFGVGAATCGHSNLQPPVCLWICSLWRERPVRGSECGSLPQLALTWARADEHRLRTARRDKARAYIHMALDSDVSNFPRSSDLGHH